MRYFSFFSELIKIMKFTINRIGSLLLHSNHRNLPHRLVGPNFLKDFHLHIDYDWCVKGFGFYPGHCLWITTLPLSWCQCCLLAVDIKSRVESKLEYSWPEIVMESLIAHQFSFSTLCSQLCISSMIQSILISFFLS